MKVQRRDGRWADWGRREQRQRRMYLRLEPSMQRRLPNKRIDLLVTPVLLCPCTTLDRQDCGCSVQGSQFPAAPWWMRDGTRRWPPCKRCRKIVPEKCGHILWTLDKKSQNVRQIRNSLGGAGESLCVYYRKRVALSLSSSRGHQNKFHELKVPIVCNNLTTERCAAAWNLNSVEVGTAPVAACNTQLPPTSHYWASAHHHHPRAAAQHF